MKRLLFIGFVFLQTCWAVAQDVQFEAYTQKNTYALNDKIRLIFSINNEGDNFTPPSFDNFKVEGPFSSKGHQTSVTIVNGQTTTKRMIQTDITFFLTPKKQGRFTIGPATIEYEGKIYKSNSLTLNITEAREIPKDPNDTDYLAGEGLHLVSEVSKTNPYTNEPITVVYKLYYNPSFSLQNFAEKETPKYNGFWSQNIEVKTLKPELSTYEGKQFGMVVLKKVVLYPIESGEKEIEPLEISLDVGVPKKERMGPFVTTVLVPVTKQVSSGLKKIKVKDLPEEGKPASFNGAVGKFNFSVKPSKEKLKAGESFSLEIKASGNGNLKLFTLFKPEFPSGFEVFEPEHKEQITTTLNGMSGEIREVYTIVPQQKGKYTLKPIDFSYFDLASNSYKTITSEEVTIEVEENPDFVPNKTQSVNSNKQEVVKNEVFQFIKTTTELKDKKQKSFFGSGIFYGLLFFPLLLIPLIVVGRKKKEAFDADVHGNKIRRNNRLVKRYLSEAKKQQGNKVPFYMAMEKALHSFLKAKLHIETSEMSKENIQELLEEKAVSSDSIREFISLMNDCEFARYAPSTSESMQHDFDKAVEVISDLEKQLD